MDSIDIEKLEKLIKCLHKNGVLGFRSGDFELQLGMPPEELVEVELKDTLEDTTTPVEEKEPTQYELFKYFNS